MMRSGATQEGVVRLLFDGPEQVGAGLNGPQYAPDRLVRVRQKRDRVNTREVFLMTGADRKSIHETGQRQVYPRRSIACTGPLPSGSCSWIWWSLESYS
jgi:hypothetical protein